mgnify:CR=1 FL=1
MAHLGAGRVDTRTRCRSRGVSRRPSTSGVPAPYARASAPPPSALLRPGLPTPDSAKLTFTSAPVTIAAGATSGTLTVQLQDGSGNATNALSTVTVSLSSSSAGGTFRDTTDTTDITQVTIATGNHAATFKYRDDTAGSPLVRAADQSGPPDTALVDATQTETVTVGTMLSDVAGVDADFRKIDGFDVLFGKGSSTLLKLKNTNPGTFHYQLTPVNETGTELHEKHVAITAKNGATLVAFVQLPSLPANVGTPIPASALGMTAASASTFSVQGAHAIKVHRRQDRRHREGRDDRVALRDNRGMRPSSSA